LISNVLYVLIISEKALLINVDSKGDHLVTGYNIANNHNLACLKFADHINYDNNHFVIVNIKLITIKISCSITNNNYYDIQFEDYRNYWRSWGSRYNFK
jgi:hypothetical protein